MKKIPLVYSYRNGSLISLGDKISIPTEPFLPPWGWNSRYILFQGNNPLIWDIYGHTWKNMPLKGNIIYKGYLFNGICVQTDNLWVYMLNDKGEEHIIKNIPHMYTIKGYTHWFIQNEYNIITFSEDFVLRTSGWVYDRENTPVYYMKGINPNTVVKLHRGFCVRSFTYNIWGEYQGLVNFFDRTSWVEI